MNMEDWNTITDQPRWVTWDAYKHYGTVMYYGGCATGAFGMLILCLFLGYFFT